MNNDLISRSALLKALDKLYMAALRKTAHSVETIYELDHLAMLVKDAPAVDAAPVRHGRWIETKTGFHCSVCKKKPGIHSTKRGADLSEYCHRCGARMDGDVNA